MSGAASVALAAASPALALAQTAPSNAPASAPGDGRYTSSAASSQGAALTEVVVTARKTTENIQKAPASIVAVTGEELSREGITNPQALEKVLPSASLRTEGPVVQTFIRGVGSNIDLPYVDPAVAFTYDGIVIPRYATYGLLYDLSSVQVISGPQGTLYGGSAAGGAVNINSRQPRNDLAGDASMEFDDYARVHLTADQDVPLGDRASARGSLDYDRRDGYQSRGFDAEDGVKGRLSLLAKPIDNLSVLAFLSGVYDDAKPPAASNNPFYDRGDPWRVPASGPVFGNALDADTAYQRIYTTVVGANVEWRVGGNVFTYIPGFVRNTVNYLEYTGDLPLTVRNGENQHTEELRWNRAVGALQLSGGLYYRRDQNNFYDFIGAPVLPVPPFLVTVPVVDIPKQVSIDYAVYGQGVYSLTTRLRLTVGLRYSDDRKTASGFGAVGQQFLPFSFGQSRDHIDWKAGVDYDLAPRILVYANAQTGYLPLGYAPVPNTATQNNYIPPERLLGFSGGVKSRFLNDKIEFNNEFYYYDYLNFQVVNFSAATGVTTTFPARRSTIYGDETNLRALLPADTEFDLGVNLMSAHYNEFTGPGFDFSGLQMVDAPVGNVNAGLQHTITFGAYGSLRGRVQTHYESGHWAEFDHAPYTHQPAYTKTDLSLLYTPDRGRWTAELYVHNVEDQPVFGALNAGGQPGPAAGFLEPPRTVGVRFTDAWN